MVGSMGRVGAAGDNAAMDSFFSLLQKNVLDRQRWNTRGELRIAIVTWIERTYHRRRRQASLGRLTPIEFEATMTTPADQAAWPTVSPVRAADPVAEVGYGMWSATMGALHTSTQGKSFTIGNLSFIPQLTLGCL